MMNKIQTSVEKAQQCLNNYDEPNEVYAVIDLLTDLIHLCREKGYDLQQELFMAQTHAGEELRQQQEEDAFGPTADKILALLPEPTEDDRENIVFWLSLYEMEPIAAAEKLSEETGLPYKEIFAIL